MLHVHRSERTDALVGMLAELVADPLDDPMQAEVVSVPTRGIERWLTQRLSTNLGTSPGRMDGVCANVEFPFPGTLVGGALALAAEIDPEADPWVPERAVWPLIQVVEEHLDAEWLAPLAEHMRNSGPVGEGSSRFSIIRHVADLFDRYAVHRPEMLQRWAVGSKEEHEAQWQFELWQRLRTRIGQASPAERLADSCRRLREEPTLLPQPRRLSMFGLTRLPASYLEVIDAVAVGRDVHLFLLHPSPALWDRLAPKVSDASRRWSRAQDPTATEPRNPLLASWGRDAREMQLVLGGAITHSEESSAVSSAPGAATTLLRRMQADIRADRAPGAHDDELPLLAEDDDSVRIHSCHGRGRQVEVLRDAILHLLADDPTLEPRDIIVMCPDIEHYAPLIQATFGCTGATENPGDPAAQLEVRLADRSLRQTNPVMSVLAEVVELSAARVTATEILDLAGRDPVRARFRLGDEDLSRLEEWVEGSCIRWGFDGSHRASFGLEHVESNTWQSGLDRILLGVTMAEDGQRLFGDTLPLDDVDNADIELAGRLAEFVGRLRRALDLLAEPKTVSEWAETLAHIADSLTASGARTAWQRSELSGLLEELVGEATLGGSPSSVLLHIDDVRTILSSRLKGRPTRANFCTGHLTVCTLVPMRSVPHRVVCLLGLDDGSFPRHIERDGDDLTGRVPMVGDRDIRSEDRQLLLDAVLAARDHLIITYSGRDERSNLGRPPAVPVGELLDVVDHTVRLPKRPARDAIVVRHPLQPFDHRNFETGVLIPGRPWSFDRLHLAGARATRSQHDAAPFLLEPLPVPPIDIIGLDQLERFLRHPVRAFLRERLGVSLRNSMREFEDAIPIELDGLEKWNIGDRMLRARLDGASAADCMAAEAVRGELPPDELAQPVLADIGPTLDALVAAGQSPLAPTSLDIQLEVDESTLVGTVPGVRGDVVHLVTYSKLNPAMRLISWLRLLALSAQWPSRPFETLTIGRGAKSGKISTSRIGPLGHDGESRRSEALAHLSVLVDLFARGMREPLPLYSRTSAAWADAAKAGKPCEAAALKAWQSGFDFDHEDKDAEHELVLGDVVSFATMFERSGAAQADEAGPGWDHNEMSRFGRLSRRLWDSVLAYEELVD